MKDRIGFVNERDYLLKKGIIKLLMVKDSDIRISDAGTVQGRSR